MSTGRTHADTRVDIRRRDVGSRPLTSIVARRRTREGSRKRGAARCRTDRVCLRVDGINDGALLGGRLRGLPQTSKP